MDGLLTHAQSVDYLIPNKVAEVQPSMASRGVHRVAELMDSTSSGLREEKLVSLYEPVVVKAIKEVERLRLKGEDCLMWTGI